MKTNWPAFRHGFLILAGAALATSPSFAQTQEPAGASATVATISSVAINQAQQGAVVRVTGTGRLDVHATRMQNPDRLVLDFAGARIASTSKFVEGDAAPVRGVRLGQFRPDVARVVIDLTSSAEYQLSQDGESVAVRFDHAPATVSSDIAPVEKVHPQFHNSNATPRLHARHSTDSQIPAPRFALPRELTQPAVMLASFNTHAEPARPAAYSQQGGGATVSPVVPANAKYSGEPISVNLKDVDLRDFFRLIHEISGLNVVLDPAVKGSLTIVLDEVPWDQALDIVLQNNNLDKQLNGNVLRIATRSTLKSEAETQRDLEKAQAEAVAPVTVTRVLSYSKAATLKETLKKFLSSRGDILSDDRSNQLIIRDIPSVIPVIDNLIHQLDRKSQQVEIEARVVSASRAFSRDIGTQLAFSGQGNNGHSFVGGDSAVGQSTFGGGLLQPPVTIASSSPPVMPLISNLAANAPTSGILLSHREKNFALDLFITAAEAKGVGKLLSKPKVITQNNEKATIKQGTKIPIQTTINNTISVQFIDAVLKLEVTPQITAEGTIFMDVLVENTQIDAGIPRVQGIPALDTEAAETKVTVADGGTVVIGGIIVTSSRIDITQVPLVGSIPIIGHLFRRQSVSTTSNELIFFLTPRILPG
jgi:type IV pilus secretin PilQ/predicted competence protein